uniref:Uncharacterized protein n=1 Tax=Lygus hesperus TaxID=30085 RepID=A0A146LBX6_LYGHE
MATCPSSNFQGMLLSNIINSTVASVDHIGVVPWALLLWVVWLILHSVYRKCFEGLLTRIGVQEPHKQRMIKIYWRLAFAAVSLPFAYQNLPIDNGDLHRDFLKTLGQLPQSLLIGEPPTFHTKFSYVLLTGFFLNTVCETCIEHGLKSWEFFLQESFTIFFICTFPLRSVYFGIALIATVNLEKSFYELSRLLCCISSIGKSNILLKTSSGVLLLHTFLWCGLYCYVLPKYFLILPVYKLEDGGDGSHVSLLLLLTFSIWAYFGMEVYSSPLSKLLLDHIYGNHRALEKILFGLNENAEEDFIIENHMNHSIERNIQEERAMSDWSHPHSGKKRSQCKVPDQRKNRENMRLMYQTVKCVIRIRRKLKKIRDQKAKETFYDAPPFMEGEKKTG